MSDNKSGDLVVHKDIRFEFELGGQAFEAVGFLEAGEECVRGDEAIRHVDNGQIVRTEEDRGFVIEHLAGLPRELQPYWLATARPKPAYPRDVSFLFHSNVEWYDVWGNLDDKWDGSVLVLRRRVS